MPQPGQPQICPLSRKNPESERCSRSGPLCAEAGTRAAALFSAIRDGPVLTPSHVLNTTLNNDLKLLPPLHSGAILLTIQAIHPMVDLAATVFISVGSGLLLGYWFRYMCLLILTAKTPRDYAGECAKMNSLSFPQIRAKLWGQASPDFDQLHEYLDRDYT